MMLHLRYKHFMSKNNPKNKIPETDKPLDKGIFLEAVSKLFSKDIPTREYPDHLKYQSDDAQEYSPGEDTDTSTESIQQPGEAEGEAKKKAKS